MKEIGACIAYGVKNNVTILWLPELEACFDKKIGCTEKDLNGGMDKFLSVIIVFIDKQCYIPK